MFTLEDRIFGFGDIVVYGGSGAPSSADGVETGNWYVNEDTGALYKFNGTTWDIFTVADNDGDVTVEGNFTTEGLVFADPTNAQSLTGPGAINITQPITLITTTGADAYTLAAGTAGQYKNIAMIGDGGDATITPTGLIGGTTITFDAVGDTVQLFATGAGWLVVGGNGYAVA